MSLPIWSRLAWPPDWWQRYKWLLVGLFLCRGVLLLCVLPPLEGCDEYQHVAYVVYLVETGRDPVLNESFVPDSLFPALARLPLPQDAVGQIAATGATGAVGYRDFWSGRAAPYQPPLCPLQLYEAQHGSLYYRLAAPLFVAAGGVAHLQTAVAVLRLMNVLLLAGAVWLALGAVGRIFPDRRQAAVAGLLIALHPFFLLSGARVANDALGVFLGTAVIVSCLSLEGRLLPRAAFLGLLLGAAVLAKAVNLALLPLVACWAAAVVVRGRASPARGAVALLLAGAGFLVVSGPSFYANWKQFGLLTPMQEAVANRAAGRGIPDLARAAMGINWPARVGHLWLSENLWSGGWSFLAPWWRLVRAYQLTTGPALLGGLMLCAGRVRRRFAGAAWPLTVCLGACLCLTAALAYHTVQTYLAWGVPATMAHYAAVAWPWFMVLVFAGAMAWPGRRLKWALPGGLAAVFMATEFHGLFVQMMKGYACQPLGAVALGRLASLQPPFLGTPTLWASTAGVLLLTTAVVLQIRGLPHASSTSALGDNPVPVGRRRVA